MTKNSEHPAFSIPYYRTHRGGYTASHFASAEAALAFARSVPEGLRVRGHDRTIATLERHIAAMARLTARVGR
jgi:hypothetical protein